MRKRLVISCVLCMLLIAGPVHQSKAIVWVVVKAAVKKVVKAIDLQIQRQQNKVIWLQNAQKTLENTLSKLKLKEIGDWTERQRTLYKDYFDELKKVKQAISSYRRVKEVIVMQVRLVEEYKRAWDLIQKDRHFTVDEIPVMYHRYQGVLESAAVNVAELTNVVNAFTSSMSDGARLEIINNVQQRTAQTLQDLRRYTWGNIKLSMQRTKSEQEIEQVKTWYGL